MNEELPEGFVVPVYRSLTQPVLVAGVPKSFAVALGMAAALGACGALSKPRYFLLVLLLEVLLYGIHRFAAARCRQDPQYFEIWQQNRGPRRLVP